MVTLESERLGRYKEQPAESVSSECGMLLQSLTAGMIPKGIVGLKFQGIGLHDPRVDGEFIFGYLSYFFYFVFLLYFYEFLGCQATLYNLHSVR